jgi:GT2 family glycosyltransferase
VTPLVSVIVLNYNGRRWLAPCLTALAGQIGAPAFEILLADNGSHDGSVALAAATFPSVRIVDNRRNLGFAAGNNRAAREARSPVLAFLNNDTVPDPHWLAALYAAHAGAAAHTIVTSRIVFLDRPEVVDSAGDGYLRAGGAYKRGHGEAAGDFLQSQEVFGACGAACMVAREFFERLGGFDERFFMVYEDVDLSYRARLAGGSCFYVADAIVRHAGSGTLGRVSDAAVFHGQRNLEWAWIKNTPLPLLLASLPSHLAYSLAGVAHYVAAGRGSAAVRGKLAALAGLPRVLRQRWAVQRGRSAPNAAIVRVTDAGWMARKRREKSARLDLPNHQDGRVS